MLSNPYIPSVIHIDHKPFIHFQNSDFHAGIYARLAAKLWAVNVVLEYISGLQNTVAHGLSRTVFKGVLKAIIQRGIGKMDREAHRTCLTISHRPRFGRPSTAIIERLRKRRDTLSDKPKL